MKKLFFLVVLLLFGACSSFSDENSTPFISAISDLQAGFADETRTYVENGRYLRWHEDDRLTAFYGNTLNRQYKFKGKTGDNSGSFAHVPSGDLETGNVFDRIYAVYPYNQTTTITDEGEISLTLPAVQSYAENSFGRGANTMIAVTENLDDTFLAFKNACGYLKLKLYNADGATIKSIEVKGNNGEKIAGAATATIAFGEAPVVTMADGSTDTITLDCGDGISLGTTNETATEFWTVIPQTTFTKGITIKITDSQGGIFEKSTDNEVAITRNAIQPMAAVEFVKPQPNNEIWYTTTDKQPIDLDAQVDGSTMFSINAFEGNVVSNNYINDKGVIIFDKPITKIGGRDMVPAFQHYETLKSLAIPEGVVDIADRSFVNLPALETLSLPSTLNLSSSSFSDMSSGVLFRCPALREINGYFATDDGRAWIQDDVMYIFASAGLTSYTIPEEVKELGDELFHECMNLTSLTLPNGLLVIGDSSIRFCTGLTTLDIPETVHTIGSCAISFCESLLELTIPQGVTRLNYDSLSGNKALVSLVLPEGITFIDQYVFDRLYNLREITIPSSVERIRECFGSSEIEIHFLATIPPELVGGNLFLGGYYHENTRIYVPLGYGRTYKTAWPNLADIIVELIPSNKILYTATEKVTPYKTNVFGANIVSNEWDSNTGDGVITFDGEVTLIGEYAFYKCNSLTSVTIPDGATSIEPLAFCDCSSLTSIIIPDRVTKIGNMAFQDCISLTSIKIPDSVTSIGKATLSGCTSLTSVNIGNGVTSIGQSTFYDCTSLTSVTILDSVIEIGDHAFTYCTSLASITIPNSVSKIGESAFFGCSSLTNITIPDSVTTIEANTFCYCTNLQRAPIPNHVTKIGDWAFNGCESLTNVAIPDGVKSIGEYAFQGCESLTSVTIPNSVTTIGECAFNGCSGLQSFKGKFASSDGRCLIVDGMLISSAPAQLTAYTIPNSVTTIGERAFAGCKSLTDVTIPDSVTTIGEYAFYDCSNLSRVYCKAITPPSLGIRVFQYHDLGYHEIIDCDIYVPTEAVYDYMSASGWSSHDIFGYRFEKNKIWYTATSKVKPYDSNYFGSSIKSNEWDSATGKGVITFYGDVTKIGEESFRECTSLESITIPNSVTTIGPNAFYYCKNLISVTMPDGLTSISYNAFLTCSILRSVTIPNSVTTIGNSAFSSCSRLIAVYCKATSPPSLGSDVFKNNATGRMIYVPAESVGTYKSAKGWSSYASDIIGYDFDKDEVVGGDSSGSYTVTLNNAWRKSTSVSNPDSSLYDGVYESYSNYNVHNSSAWMYINIEGYDSFTIYVRSYAESSYDYVNVYNLDSTSSVKTSTQGNQKSGTSISSYTPVTFSNIGGGSHRIAIQYRKDSSQNANSDRGYVLIPKNQ